jgi:Transketolase, thiamine diphosphate binding domain
MAIEEDDLRPDVILHTHEGGPVRGTGAELLSVNTIRTLAMDPVEAAGSATRGPQWPWLPWPTSFWTRFLRHDPSDPGWPDPRYAGSRARRSGSGEVPARRAPRADVRPRRAQIGSRMFGPISFPAYQIVVLEDRLRKRAGGRRATARDGPDRLSRLLVAAELTSHGR